MGRETTRNNQNTQLNSLIVLASTGRSGFGFNLGPNKLTKPWKPSVTVDIFFLTAIGLTAGGTSNVHSYTQTVHRATQLRRSLVVHF